MYLFHPYIRVRDRVRVRVRVKKRIDNEDEPKLAAISCNALAGEAPVT
jgi:hypothetical protein